MTFDPIQYCRTVAEDHRKGMGQFFTHAEVADFMVRWVLASGVSELYDPAFGLGAFLPNDPDVAFSASEIDSVAINYCREKAASKLPFVFEEDYLTSWGKSHPNIVCNPPYMRFQKFLTRGSVFADFKKHLDLTLSGYTNTASAFLLKSLSELDGRGRLSYIMPLEFLNTGYGTLVKKRLLEGRHLVGIINLECEKDIFPDATTSVGILLYDCAVECSKVSFYSLKRIEELKSFDSLEPTTIIDADKLDPKSKWLPHFQSNKVLFNQEHMVPLEYYGRFSRGIATGANEFFVLSKSKAASLGLSPDDCQPCITRSSQISHPVISDKDVSEMLDADIPAILFAANGSASAEARKYIRHGESLGYHERFLTKHRTPWYKTETRSPSPLLLGVFSRGGYKIILNRSNALNLTCYHGFQPNLFGLQYVNHLFLYFLSQTGRDIIGLSMRKYGDALDKFEPNDLNSAFVPKPDYFDKITDKDVENGIRVVSSEGMLPEVLEMKFSQLSKRSPTMQSTQRLPASRSMLGRYAPGMDRATGSRG